MRSVPGDSRELRPGIRNIRDIREMIRYPGCWILVQVSRHVREGGEGWQGGQGGGGGRVFSPVRVSRARGGVHGLALAKER